MTERSALLTVSGFSATSAADNRLFLVDELIKIDHDASTIDKEGPAAVGLIDILAWASIALAQSIPVADIDGRPFDPFAASPHARVLLFVASDCPISNGYAPDVRQLCSDYGRLGVRCALVYEDLGIDAAAVRRHLDEYGYAGISAAIDRDRTIAGRAKASVTPEAVVVDATGRIRYRGRIDNRYVDLGKPRRVVTVHDLRDALDAVLAGKAVRQPETTALGCHIVGERK